jgi:copper(I)-binding protein
MRYIFLICMTLLTQASWAKLTIQDAYARASHGPNSVIFMTIQNDGSEDARLTGAKVSSDICKTSELHTHIQEGDVFKMRKVKSLDIPANSTLALKPGGNHIMLMNLIGPLKDGQIINVTLVFKQLAFKHQPMQSISVPVRSISTCGCSKDKAN